MPEENQFDKPVAIYVLYQYLAISAHAGIAVLYISNLSCCLVDSTKQMLMIFMIFFS